MDAQVARRRYRYGAAPSTQHDGPGCRSLAHAGEQDVGVAADEGAGEGEPLPLPAGQLGLRRGRRRADAGRAAALPGAAAHHRPGCVSRPAGPGGAAIVDRPRILASIVAPGVSRSSWVVRVENEGREAPKYLVMWKPGG